jgi:long-chain acyl-CoA synthetase
VASTTSTHLPQLLFDHARRHPDLVLLARRAGSIWNDVTAADFAAEVQGLAKGLIASGVAPGDRVGLMSRTRYEWTLCDFAIWTAGAVTVPVYETSSAEQLCWNLADSAAVGAIVETSVHERLLAEVRAELPELRRSWAFGAAGAAGLPALVEAGRTVSDEEVQRRLSGLGPDSLATVIYTSGTTGQPKGCRLTHGNFLVECRAAISALPELFEHPDASTLLFLPLAHVFGRMIQVAVVMNGTRLAHSDPARLPKDLLSFRPTFVLAVPRIFEKLHDTARRKAVSDGRGRVFDLAAATAVAYSEALEAGGPGAVLRVRHAAYDRLVYSRLRAALGGNTRWSISGGAPLAGRLAHFFRGAGVTVLEGYGLTETTAAATVNTRERMRVGTVGRPLDGVEVRIARDGEVQVRGGIVFPGYWRDEAATAAALHDGWFASGDLGSLDAEGFLTITGRKKELLVTSGGKNVSPAALEDAVRGHRLVSQCVVLGDRRPYIGALVTLDAAEVSAWLAGQGRPDQPVAALVDDERLRAEIQQAVDAANAAVSAAEGIKRFRILPVDLSEEAGHITPTLKVKRDLVLAEFAADVEALYAPAARTRR